MGLIRLLLGVLLFSLVLGSAPVLAQERGQTARTTLVRDSARHAQFSRLLAHYVNEQGRVDYAQLKRQADSALAPYLQQLAATNPARLSRDARLAFWINAYNAYALKLIVDHYPVSTIWATTPGPAKPTKEKSPFEMEIGTVADTTRTLDEIEHRIIRKRFDEPRIHFALVCAAASCPRLRREAYTGPRLDAQLDDQARTFLHDEQKNRIPGGDDRIALSRILKWYGQDFGPSTDDLQQFLARYFEGPVRDRLSRADYTVDFRPYDWSLNDQGEMKEGATSSSD
jgi:hypothetical protein